MAVTTAQVSVTTSATLICRNTASVGADDSATLGFVVKNTTGTANVFVGPTGVTTGTGFQWSATDGPLSIDLEPQESLYGIVAATTQVLHVLGVGR